MLGLSRHVYVLATNRQIPSWLGKLNRRYRTPHVAIIGAAVFAFGLIVPTDIALLGGPVRVRGDDRVHDRPPLRDQAAHRPSRTRERPFRVPFNVRYRGAQIPLPTVVAAVLTALAWLSVIVYHDTARWVGGGWMVFGLVAYVIYRKGIEGTTLTRAGRGAGRGAGEERSRTAEYGDILVPVFGTELDDDIVGTAGRLADAADTPGETAPKLEVIYVVDLPLTVPLDSPPPADRAEAANRGARAGPAGRRGVRHGRGAPLGGPGAVGRGPGSCRPRATATWR